MKRMRSLDKSLNLFSLHVLVLQTINEMHLYMEHCFVLFILCVRDLFVLFSQNKIYMLYLHMNLICEHYFK